MGNYCVMLRTENTLPVLVILKRTRILPFVNPGGSGYDVVWGDNFSHVAWGSVRSVVEKTRYFQFRFNKYDSYIIPKRFFHNESEQELLREILRSNLGSKAKLFQSNEGQL